MNKKFIALLATGIISIPILLSIAADFTVSSLRLQSSANGAFTNAFTNLALVDIQGKARLAPTNLFVGVNQADTVFNAPNSALFLQQASGGVSNNLTRPGTIVYQTHLGTGVGTNVITGDNNLVGIYTDSDGGTNNVTVSSDANLLSISTDGDASAIVEVTGSANVGSIRTELGRGSGPGYRHVVSGANNVIASRIDSTPTTNIIGTAGSVVTIRAQGGVSSVGGAGSVVALVSPTAAASNTFNVNGSLLAMYNAGNANISANNGGFYSLFGNTTTTTTVSGSPSLLSARNESGNVTLSGNGAWLIGYSDAVTPGLSTAQNFAGVIGGGITNTFPKSLLIGYGIPTMHFRTNGFHTFSDLVGASAAVNWNMATNAYLGRVTLPAAAASVFITNAIVTANSVVLATFNDLDTTATQLAAIPTAGELELRVNAAATADTRISWQVLAP